MKVTYKRQLTALLVIDPYRLIGWDLRTTGYTLSGGG